jgi:hypothetical protein
MSPPEPESGGAGVPSLAAHSLAGSPRPQALQDGWRPLTWVHLARRQERHLGCALTDPLDLDAAAEITSKAAATASGLEQAGAGHRFVVGRPLIGVFPRRRRQQVSTTSLLGLLRLDSKRR